MPESDNGRTLYSVWTKIDPDDPATWPEKDVGAVLVCFADGGQEVGVHIPGNGWWCNTEMLRYNPTPTHWTPLPPLPTDATQRQETTK